ncbi:sugar ABC transporter ATP-binding protein [Mycolicibacterium sp. P1-18]|uniref:sugar ABC transporter ATP-binding protein n=1 Tax=Mycolicibacterium sp. P1-18 TaxID=2024615 RepID=UPI0011F2C9B4|nr:sugar ABC transporter ATP-binding protein [Mycolicibacterium sp. P1-18]KAA0098764.1 sugar ABC transporter ATP-binding protein [Mycolicibacterium sp. P1-18]
MTEQPSSTTPLIDIRGVSKSYVGVTALHDATLTIAEGEVRALLGRNGAGKSTLIRILSGVEHPDAGSVTIAGQSLDGGVRRATELGVQTVHQELSLVPEMTVAENLFVGSWPRRAGKVDYATMRSEAASVVERLGLEIDPDAAVGTLSLAAQQLVEICRAVRRNPRLLILDEPTSALAATEVTIVLDAVLRIAASGVAVIYVSHRLDEIRRIASTATILRDGRVIDTVDVASTTTDAMVTMMVGPDYRAEERPPLRDVDRSTEALLSVRNLVVPPKVSDISFDLYAGEVLGIAGLMGSGRTEVLRAIAGFEAVTGGEVILGGRTMPRGAPATMKRHGVGLTPEDRKREAIVPLLGVDENMVLSDYGRVRGGAAISASMVRAAARSLIDRLAIDTASPSTPIVNLSGGNQQKAVIGRWLHADASILLLDEPTRGVDVAAKAGIYRLVRELADAGKAVVFVSGELEELPLVCDRVITITGGRITAEFIGRDVTVDAVLSAAMAA